MTAREFPLAWRSTQSEHGIIPAEVLARIIPLTATEADQCNQASLAFFQPNHTLSPALFGTIISRRNDNIPASECRTWLLDQQPADAPVVVSWQSDLGVRTTWYIFADYWDAFCYASSDDVIVWPEGKQWVLAYYHYELFEFGKNRKP